MSTGYSQKNKERLRKEASERYQDLSQKKKKKRLQRRLEQQKKNLSDDGKHRIAECRRNYYIT